MNTGDNTENEKPQRKVIRLKEYDYSSPGAYFVTICTENRKNYFWYGDVDLQKFNWLDVGANCVRPQKLPLSGIGKIVANELDVWHVTYKNVVLSSYIIMPNHLHIMIIIYPDANGQINETPTIGRMVKQFKGAVTKKAGRTVWQKSFVEHIVRSENDYLTRLKYIYENPMRWHEDELYYT